MFWTQNSSKITLAVRVLPNARRSSFNGLWNDMVKISLAAPAVDGKANEALISFLSDFFDLRKSAIVILSGQTSRIKKISLDFPNESAVIKAVSKLQTL